MNHIHSNISIEGKMNIRIVQPQILKNIWETNLQMIVLFSIRNIRRIFRFFFLIFTRNRLKKRDREVESGSPQQTNLKDGSPW